MGSALQLRRLALVATLLACGSAQVSAETAEEELFLVDQRVRSSFQPWTTFLFSTAAEGSVKNTAAVVLPAERNPGEYLTATALKPVPSKGDFYSTFFLKGRDAAFAATPVRTLKAEADRSPPRKDFEARALEVETLFQELSKSVAQKESQLKVLRDKAMKLAGVDEIVRLQMEHNRLQASGDRRVSEQTRLRELINLGRKLPDPEGIDLLRQKLSGELRDTAQATALADRLKVRKKQAAKETLQEKLNLVKEMSKYNREEIAREILALRARRKELEKRIGALIPAEAQEELPE